MSEENFQIFLTSDFPLSAEKAAEQRNCKAVFPTEHQLQIDIDSEKQYEYFLKRFKELTGITKELSGSKFIEEVSSSGMPHRHITVSLFDEYGEKYKVIESQRIMLQFMLGSDPIRETFSVFRWLVYDEHPTRFFETLMDTEND